MIAQQEQFGQLWGFFSNPSPILRRLFPEGVVKESQREVKPLSINLFPPLLLKERGIKGVRLVNILNLCPVI